MSRGRSSLSLDGVAFDVNAAGLARCVHLASVTSTMDHAHALAAACAPSGTLVVADVQTSGRGRGGKTWVSHAGQGLWCTLIERTPSPDALAVLSLRVGLAVADVAQQWCALPVQLKWPNDVLLPHQAGGGTADTLASPRPLGALGALGKLAGVLVEARWRESAVEWVAIGIGVNLRDPAGQSSARSGAGFVSACLEQSVTRADFLAALVPRLRTLPHMQGVLSPTELGAWQSRDAMRGRACVLPEPGVVDGIDADGALRIARPDGQVSTHRSGSLVLSGESATC